MRDQDKTHEQLISELVKCRQQVDQLIKSETELRQNLEVLRETEIRYHALVEYLPGVGPTRQSRRQNRGASAPDAGEVTAD